MMKSCPYCIDRFTCSDENRKKPQSAGKYWRKSDGRWIQRFYCRSCKKGFSAATNHLCFNQNKRHKNRIICEMLAAGVSGRAAARMTRVNRKTVVRKLLFWAKIAEEELNSPSPQLATEVEFDDLETFEHTKCKPLSVTMMVQTKTRKILGLQVSQMPCKGKLAALSRRKYGPRQDLRTRGRRRLFELVQSKVHPEAIIKSDSSPHYPADVRHYFPRCTHQTVKGMRGSSVGGGELKKIKWDPIFSLNHTFAMLRSNVNRLVRRTWATTKRPDRLYAHLMVYSSIHNRRVQEQQAKK